jgi:hypothetical protein
MRQPLNANPRLDEQVRRALNKIKRPSTAEEITELLNQELSPGDNPFSEAEVDRWLRDNREKSCKCIGCGIAHSDEFQTARSKI